MLKQIRYFQAVVRLPLCRDGEPIRVNYGVF